MRLDERKRAILKGFRGTKSTAKRWKALSQWTKLVLPLGKYWSKCVRS